MLEEIGSFSRRIKFLKRVQTRQCKRSAVSRSHFYRTFYMETEKRRVNLP